MGVITLMGSGEISPTMVKIHRRLLDRRRPARTILLDTPYGFQENADLVTGRITDYFEVSLQQVVEVPSYRSAGSAGPEGLARLKASVAEADYVFSGPGSPSYALRQWTAAGVGDALADAVQQGAAVTLASAAAITAGRYAVPVYEIYKVGEEPFWLEGLDVVGRILGIPVAVIPHFDNAEGGNHDTRFCYLGRNRLEVMRSLLGPNDVIFGIDEHTAVSIEDGVASVEGRGAFTVLAGSDSHRIPAGGDVRLAEVTQISETGVPPGSRDTAGIISFDAALAAHDPQAAADAALIALDSGRADSVASMILRLASAAEHGLVDQRTRLAPLVDLLLDIRRRAREADRWDESDLIRSELATIGIEVRDTPSGAEWHLTNGDRSAGA